MKKRFSFILSGTLVLVFLLAMNPCHAQTADSTVANQFISLSDEGNYTEASKLMSPGFQGMISPDNLQKIWYYHVQPHGKFHGVLSVREMQQGKIYAVFPTCRYDHATITFAFAFDDNHQIAGFHVDTVVPNAQSDATSVPKAIYHPEGH